MDDLSFVSPSIKNKRSKTHIFLLSVFQESIFPYNIFLKSQMWLVIIVCMIILARKIVCVSLWITFVKQHALIINYFNYSTCTEIPYFAKINISICLKKPLNGFGKLCCSLWNLYKHYKIPWVNLNWDDQTLNNLYVFLIVILSQYYCFELIVYHFPQGLKGLHKQNTFILPASPVGKGGTRIIIPILQSQSIRN